MLNQLMLPAPVVTQRLLSGHKSHGWSGMGRHTIFTDYTGTYHSIMSSLFRQSAPQAPEGFSSSRMHSHTIFLAFFLSRLVWRSVRHVFSVMYSNGAGFSLSEGSVGNRGSIREGVNIIALRGDTSSLHGTNRERVKSVKCKSVAFLRVTESYHVTYLTPF